MIEINLLPDIKREFLQAQKVRNRVMATSMIAGVLSLGIVGLIIVWIGLQAGRELLINNAINSESKKLSSVEAINEAVTIQNQLGKVNELHDKKALTSRIFNMITVINPPAPNNIGIVNMVVNTEDNSIKMEAQATGGYAALETFRKTITATTISYVAADGSDEKLVEKLAADLDDTDRSYADNSDGQKVLKFTLSFTYNGQLLSRSATQLSVNGPNQSNATDSFIGTPDTLFVEAVKEKEKK